MALKKTGPNLTTESRTNRPGNRLPEEMDVWGGVSWEKLRVRCSVTLPETNSSPMKIPSFLVNTIKMVDFPWLC